MCPVVLLLLCVSVAAEYQLYPDVPCDDGWSHMEENRCVKYINSSKTFHEAQEHCRNLNGDLVSLHGYDEMLKVISLSRRADPRRQSIWIGAQRSGTGIKYNYRGSEACVTLKVKGRGSFSHVRCSKRKRFVCAKNVSISTPDAGPAARPPDSDRQVDPRIEERNPQPAGPKGPKDSTQISRPDTAPSVEDAPEETLELRAKD